MSRKCATLSESGLKQGASLEEGAGIRPLLQRREVVDLQISSCLWNQLHTGTAYALEVLRRFTTYGDIKLTYIWEPWSRDALIGRARSISASKFLKTNAAPYLLFLDWDILFAPQDVVKILGDMKSGYDIVGGTYVVRDGVQLASHPWNSAYDIAIEGEQPFFDGKIHEIEYLATGFMGISRSVLGKMVEELNLPLLNKGEWSECYPFFESGRYDRKEAPIYISEDWDFCIKARQVGIKSYLDTSVNVGHIGDKVWRVNEMIQTKARQFQEEKVYFALNKQKEQLQNIEEDVAAFLHLPSPEIVVKRMGTIQEELADSFKVRKDSVEEWYAKHKAYLFDLALFNKYPQYFTNRLAQLLTARGIKVLDIGCGIGTAVFMMSDQGCDVLGYDICEQAIAFAKFRKRKYNMGGEFTTEKPSDLSQYDLVTMVDVTEHIEDLQGFLRWLCTGMKSGAKLFHFDCFKDEGKHPMHFAGHKEHIDQWLKEAGFARVDETWAVKI